MDDKNEMVPLSDIKTSGFGLIKTSSDASPKIHFSYSRVKAIKVGNEGDKVIGSVSSRRGKHATYFIKEMVHYGELKSQLKMYLDLKKRGIRVPAVFKASKLEDGRSVAVISDEAENEKYLVLSTNNPELTTRKFHKLTTRIPNNVKTQVRLDLIRFSEQAALINPESINKDDVSHELAEHAFMLKINPNNPAETYVLVADFGINNRNQFTTPSETNYALSSNIAHASSFYAQMFGEPLIFPEDSNYGRFSEKNIAFLHIHRSLQKR